jgi:hypothetical protein
MATPGELVATTAKVLGIPEVTVVQHDRNLMAAGRRTKGGRGLSAAKVTNEDAANLLIASVGSWQIRDTLEALEIYGGTSMTYGIFHEDGGIGKPVDTWQLSLFPITELQQLPPGHSFLAALIALIQAASRNAFKPKRSDPISPAAAMNLTIRIEFIAPNPLVNVTIEDSSHPASFGEQHFYTYPSNINSTPSARSYFSKINNRGDLEQHRIISLKTINAIGKLLRAH